MMKVKDAMNPHVITLKPEMTIKEASEIMAKKGINGAPVVDSQGRLVGILTLKDILEIIKTHMENLGVYIFPTPFDFMETIPLSLPQESQKDAFSQISNIRVEDAMERRVHYVTEDDDIYDALYLLVKKEVSRLPVVDKNKRVIGIITRSDILKALSKASEKVSEKVSED